MTGLELGLGVVQTALLAEIARRQGRNTAQIDTNTSEIGRLKKGFKKIRRRVT
jgi:hypothetical protein